MPFPGEHAARIRPPQEFDDFRRDNDAFGQGIDAIYGLRTGINGKVVSELQAIRFDKGRFTAEQARAWLAEHKQKFISFEPASEPKGRQAGGRVNVSDLRVLGQDFVKGRYEEKDGGIVIHDVKLLASGTWTDSAKKTPFAYTPQLLEKSAANWHDNAVWSRHLGGTPRGIVEKIGLVQNQRYLDNAVIGDIYLHGKTQNSRDTIEVVKAGLASYVSVEHYSENEKHNPKIKAFEADAIHFMGLAVVNKGACQKCRLNESEKNENEVEMSDTEKAELEARIKALSDEKATIETKMREMEAKLTAAEEVKKIEQAAVKALEERLKKLESTPAPKTAAVQERQLEEPKLRVIVDKRTGEVYPA